jgi:nitrous oxidase accessory protein
VLRLKKKTAFLLCLLLVSTFVAVAGVRPSKSSPSTLYVPDQYPTIQAALAAAVAGDTIIVRPNVYHEHGLVVTQNGLTLQGENRDTTIIDGDNSNGEIITVNADNVVISGFTIRNAGSSYGAFGVFLNYYSDNCYLSDNSFSGCSFFIRAENCTDVTVSSSVFSKNTYAQGAAVYVLYCQTGLVEGNFFDTDYVGVFIIHSTGFAVRNNVFSSCILTGATVSYSEQNWLAKNTFTDNNSSISIKYNGNNFIVGNTISNSKNAGLLLQTSPNNAIHHNNFINNAKQVSFVDSTPPSNVWNTSVPITEGNYWSDYTGIDANKNGIGDTPYTVAANNQDSSPLAGRFSEFSVTSQTGTYNAYTISNSTVTNLSFDQVGNKIVFSVSGPSGKTGVCRIVFPKALLGIPYTVYVNDQIKTYGSIANSTHIALYFNYVHASQASSVVVVPEFPVFVVLVFFLLLTSAVAVTKRKGSHNKQTIRTT